MSSTLSVDLAYLSISETGKLFRQRELSPVDLTQYHLDRINQLNPKLRAFITVTDELALQQAKEAEEAIYQGDTRPLLGIPFAHKDIYMTEGILTTAGSAVYADYIPDKTATTVSQLHDQGGAVFVGKLSTHEFASGISTEDHPFPPARNPWNLDHIPGGSSSGSGTSVAAGLVMGALGTDTGGSIRHPGSACGIAALKPTYGRCSRYGVFDLSWSLDHTGPMARSCEDVALMLGAIAAYDPKDPASANVPTGDYTTHLKQDIKGMKLGVLRSWYEPSTTPEALSAMNEVIKTYLELGAEIVDVEVPSISLASIQGVISRSEAYSYHADNLKKKRDLYPGWLRNSILSGGLYTAEEYITAQRARQILKLEVDNLFKDVDVLLSPTRGDSAMTFEQAYINYQSAQASFTRLYNITGHPAISIPCGFSSSGLPFGLQIAGRPFDEATVLQVGYAYEKSTEWHKLHPSL